MKNSILMSLNFFRSIVRQLGVQEGRRKKGHKFGETLGNGKETEENGGGGNTSFLEEAMTYSEYIVNQFNIKANREVNLQVDVTVCD